MIINWNQYPEVNRHSQVRDWLFIQISLGLARNTIIAYTIALEEFALFSHENCFSIDAASRADITKYLRYIVNRPNKRSNNVKQNDSIRRLSNATIQQRLTAVRLFYDYLIEEGVRELNPVGRGRYTPDKQFRGAYERGIFPRFHKLPWIPTDEIWERILKAAGTERIRNKFMLALAYDAALRREELCTLKTGDIDPSKRLIRIRAETTKTKRERIVHYSVSTGDLFAGYLNYRKSLSRNSDYLFLSESNRNKSKPISIWTWTKVVESIAERAETPQFTTHTLRHLCLTDLAQAGWDIHEIAAFAGHSDTNTTLKYIHLSGQDLINQFERSNNHLHRWRAVKFQELFDNEQ